MTDKGWQALTSLCRLRETRSPEWNLRNQACSQNHGRASSLILKVHTKTRGWDKGKKQRGHKRRMISFSSEKQISLWKIHYPFACHHPSQLLVFGQILLVRFSLTRSHWFWQHFRKVTCICFINNFRSPIITISSHLCYVAGDLTRCSDLCISCKPSDLFQLFFDLLIGWFQMIGLFMQSVFPLILFCLFSTSGPVWGTLN